MKKFLKNWLLVFIWAGLIFLLSSLPYLESGLDQDFTLRKIAHILEYAILTFLLIRAFHPTADQHQKILVLAIIIALLYSISDEYHQTFILGRSGKLIDIGIDSIGILLTGFLCYIKNKGRNNQLFRN